MDLIAENGHRKWAYRAQMVTTVTALVLLGMQAEPAIAAKPINLLELFNGPPRLRGVHPAKIPLPRPRPAEAPAPDGDSPAATAQPAEPDERTDPDKPAEQASPAVPPA